MIFKKKDKDRGEEQVEEPRQQRYLGEEPTIIGIFSGKGGCGKSSIATSLCLLFSGLGYGCILVDFDVINATSTSQLFALDQESLDIDYNASVLHILNEAGELALIQPRRLSIPFFDNINEGYDASKKLWVLPARLSKKPETVNFITRLSLLARNKEKIYSAINSISSYVIEIAKKNKIKYIIYDTPPLKAEGGRATFAGSGDIVSMVMDSSKSALLISSFDPSSIEGLATMVAGPYARVKSKVDALVVNMSLDDQDVQREIMMRARLLVDENNIFFIRYDSAWASLATYIPPIAYRLEGASEDLIRIAYALGYISKKDTEKLRMPVNLPRSA